MHMRLRLCLIACLLGCSSLASAGSRWADLSERYLTSLFAAKPHLATFMGDHRFDDKLPDLGAAALQARERELVAMQGELAITERKAEPIDDAIDREIVSDAIALELLYLREIRDWEWDPRLYDSFPYYDPREIVAGRLSDIIHGAYAPEAERRKSVTAQIVALPKLLTQETAALERSRTATRHPPKVHVEQAIKGNTGRIEFFETELKAFIGKDAVAEAARVRAVAALQKYQRYLETDLLPRADGDFRLGAALYAKKFTLALQTKRSPKEVVPSATEAFHRARAELYTVALRLHRQLWPKDAVPAADAAPAIQAKTIGRVKDELSKDHAKPADLVASHGRNLDALRAFIEKHKLLSLPPKETLTVEPMPAFKRGSSAAEYLAPGVLDRSPSWHATYYVDPIDPTWDKERVESYLRGQNDYEVQLVAAHEAYPGHHTQYFYSKRNLDPVRAVLWNAAMVEGWAVYGEGIMVKLGWGEQRSDRFRFFDLRGQMIVATNILLDIGLQSGTMSDEEAVRFMVEEGFQERAMAEKKLLRAKLDSTQLAQYFLGLDEITALEADYRKKVGKAFDQRTFDEALIGHGSIAVRLLRRYLLGN